MIEKVGSGPPVDVGVDKDRKDKLVPELIVPFVNVFGPYFAKNL